MDFDLSEEQQVLQQTVRKFVLGHCTRDYVRHLEKEELFPQELWRKLAELGFMSVLLPESKGGPAGTTLEMVIIIEELARGMVSLAIPFINTVALTSKLLCEFGRTEQQVSVLEGMCAGELKTCFAWTEPSGGTDVLSMSTQVTKRDDGAYVVNGTKTFITLAHEAQYIFTMARSVKKPAKKTEGITCLMIPSDSSGISIRKIDKVGQVTTGFCEVHFDNVKVSSDYLIGDEGNAWKQVLPLLNGERTLFSAVCLGIAEAALADAIDYMAERQAFGKTINHFQALQHYVAEMRTMIDACRLMTYQAAWMEAMGKPVGVAPTQAFLAASNMVSKVTDLGMQIMGGYGYTKEFDMERYWRDGRVFRVSPVTSEMAKNHIAQSMGMPRSY